MAKTKHLSIRLTIPVARRLDKYRTTPKGKVTYSAAVEHLLDNKVV